MRKNKMEKNIKITNKKQFKAMVEWMKQHPDIAKGKGHYGPNKCQLKEKIEELAFEMNAYGPPIRLPEEWLRVWTHFKANLKRKIANNKKSLHLSPMEEAVANLTKCNVLTKSLRASLGSNGKKVKENDIIDVEVNSQTNSTTTKNEETHQCLSRENINEDSIEHNEPISCEKLMLEVLKAQTENQKLIIEKLVEIERNTKEILNVVKKRDLEQDEESTKEILNVTKQKMLLCEENTKEILKLKKTKLEMYEENMKEIIGIKRKKLEILEEERKKNSL
uniref:Regulatory protein zeste n=1 Tax=Glossina palpalis gambiensis TaxID=67801 RepID=A0A1B0AM08_9MUSC